MWCRVLCGVRCGLLCCECVIVAQNSAVYLRADCGVVYVVWCLLWRCVVCDILFVLYVVCSGVTFDCMGNVTLVCTCWRQSSLLVK